MKSWAYKWQVLVAVIFGAFMVMMDATVVNVALPKIQQVFGNGNLTEVQWVISAYTLALGIVSPLAGFLADRFGIKRMYIVSLGLFTLGSALCAIAPNVFLLVLFRVIQGVGGGSLIPLGTAQLFRAFPREERGTAYGFFGIAMVMAPALGPLLSGFFVEYLDWRLIFVVNVPIGLLGMYIGATRLREEKAEEKPRLDQWGVVTSVVAFGLLLYAFSSAEQDGWGSLPVVLALVIGGLGLLALIFIELGQKDGLVDLTHFRKSTFRIGALLGWVSVIALFGAEFLLPLYLQILRGQTPLQTGLMLLPLALTSGFVVPLAGKLSDKIGARPLVLAGFLLIMFNTWQFTSLKLDTDLFYVGVLMAIRGIAFGLIIQVTQQVSLQDIEPQALPRATSLISSSRLIFQSLGVALMATLVSATAGPRPQFGAGVRPDPVALLAYRENFLQGLSNAYLATFWLAVVAVVLAVFLPGWPGKVVHRQEQPALEAEAIK